VAPVGRINADSQTANPIQFIPFILSKSVNVCPPGKAAFAPIFVLPEAIFH
jgi:hypothetical protein